MNPKDQLKNVEDWLRYYEKLERLADELFNTLTGEQKESVRKARLAYLNLKHERPN